MIALNNPLISIIVPIYNAEKYLEKTLVELVNQTYDNLEIILVDDGSTDKSGEICDRFAKEYKNIRVLHQQNSGVCAARNNGIAAAKGSLIGFCDSDDLPDRDLYETLCNVMLENDAELSMVDVKIVLPNGSEKTTSNGELEIWNTPDEFAYKFFTQYMNIGVYTKLFKREICDKIRFEEGRKINEDMFYFFEAAVNSKKTVHKSVAKYTYFRRDGSSTLNGFSDKFFDCIYFADRIVDITKQRFPKLENYAVANKISTSLRVLKRMITMGGYKKYSDKREKIISYIRGFDRKYCKKYLKQKDYTRFSVLKLNKKLFCLMTEYFDKY